MSSACDRKQCPLLGVKRTLIESAPMSAFDPKRTFVDGLQFSVTREGEEDWDVRGHTKGAPTITVGAILRNFWATARTGVPAKPQYGGLTAVNVVFVVLIRRPVLFPECFEPLRKLPAGLFHGRNHNDLLWRHSIPHTLILPPSPAVQSDDRHRLAFSDPKCRRSASGNDQTERYSNQHNDARLLGSMAWRMGRPTSPIIEPDPACRYEDACPQQKMSQCRHHQGSLREVTSLTLL
jgi:hypothetical protein